MHKSENNHVHSLHEIFAHNLNVGTVVPAPKKVRDVYHGLSTTPDSSPNQENTSSPSHHLPDSRLINDSMVKNGIYQENVGGTTYFYPPPQSGGGSSGGGGGRTPPNNIHDLLPLGPTEYSMYSVPNHVATTLKTDSFFVSKHLQNDMLNRRLMTLMYDNSPNSSDLPQIVESYHQLCPLERTPSSDQLHKQHLSYLATMYKGVHVKNGNCFCLRRIHGFRLQNSKCMVVVDSWKNLKHPNIVHLQEVFTTKAFGDNSIVFVYDYHPCSETLMSKYFSSDHVDPFAPDTSPRPYSHQKNTLLRHQQTNKISEVLLWNYIIQLTNAIRLIHSSGLACRNLDPSKILITSKNRLRLSCLGVIDVILNEGAAAASTPSSSSTSSSSLALVQHYQQEDLTALGKLVLALACRSTLAFQRDNINTALDIVARSYTTDLRNLIVYLLSSQQRKSITDLMPMIGARFYMQMEYLHNYIDVLECEVGKELENGRLFRLLAKLGTINERPECNLDGAWSETGDRYMLKLFRDYIFHQVTEDGRPWVDMAHIIQCLNRLDAGTPEKICLMSRDEQSMLVVTYGELKQCLEQSYSDVIVNATTSTGAEKKPDTIVPDEEKPYTKRNHHHPHHHHHPIL